MHCKHISWLGAVRDRDSDVLFLENTTRLSRVLQDMTHPDRQTPRLVHFIGTRTKDGALKYLFPNNNFSRQYERGSVNLRADISTLGISAPLLIADSNPFCETKIKTPQATCHITHSFPITWGLDNHELVDILYSRLFFPFSDLVCVFADDFPSLDNLALRINSWITARGPSYNIPPRLVVIICEGGPLGSLLDEEFRLALHSHGEEALAETFSSVKIFRLAGEYLSPIARYQRLRDQVYEHTATNLLQREENGYNFSATHFNAFFDIAVKHIAETRVKPLDLIKASGGGKFRMIEDLTHMKTIFQLAASFKTPHQAIASFMASCILVDAFPPRMHNFLPQMVFQSVYYDKCIEALRGNFSLSYAKYMVETIATEFNKLNQQLLKTGCSTKLHVENARHVGRWVSVYKTNTTCIVCVSRSPERPMSCGHSICDICIRRFGKEVVGRENRFYVNCIFNDLGHLVADLKPKTAGIRILSLDGGGSRGVAPLEFLKMLQDQFPGCPLHEQIDYSAGTSSGGLINLGLFYRQWNINKCHDAFESMAIRCFKSSNSMYTLIRSALRWVITDGFYDETILESSLQEVIGPFRLFEYLPDTVSGTRFALTATSKGNSRWIFANYNASLSKARNDYNLVRTENIEDEVYAWEAGRATSAAPVFFKPIQINSEMFWDGGLVFPDPVRLALLESERLWPEAVPDVIISLGTGIQPKKAGGRRSLSRLWAGFMDYLDGESHSRDVGKGPEKQISKSFFRFNAKLHRPIRLDNTEDLEEIRQAVHMSPTSRIDAKNTAIAVLLSNFYFRLDKPPTYTSGLYHYIGSIRCRGNSQKVIEDLKNMHQGNMKFVTETTILGDCGIFCDICETCSRYRKPVVIHMRHPTDYLTISVRIGNRTCKIGGFPQKMSWFEEQGGFNNMFGTEDHDVPGALQCSSCSQRVSSGPWKHTLPSPDFGIHKRLRAR